MSKSESVVVSDSIKEVLPNLLTINLEKKIKEIVKVATDTYKDLLLDSNYNHASLSNPNIFFEDYIEEIKKFKYIISDDGNITFVSPDEESFNFSDKLEILKFIVEGVAGNYFELPEKDLEKVLRAKRLRIKIKTQLNVLPGVHSKNVPIEMRFSLISTGSKLIHIAQTILHKKLVKFPFSNSPPVSLFDPIHTYVDNNIEGWIDESITDSINYIKKV